MNRKEEIEARLAEISAEVDSPEADLDALEEEVRSLKAEKAEIEKAEEEARLAEEEKIEQREALLAEVEHDGVVVEKFETEEREKEMTEVEVRNSKEYIDAFANYIKTNDDKECRALLTENVSGSVPVPQIVDDIIRHAWEKQGIIELVKKTYIKGNVRVGVEISGDDAQIHVEGDPEVTEEELQLYVVNLIPQSIKKWISISDEVFDMTSDAFLTYIYEELTYRISKKLADELVTLISSMDDTSDVPQSAIDAAPDLTTIAKAVGHLSDEATNPVIVMNKLTYAAFKEVQAAGNYAWDIFEGLTVLFNDTLSSYDDASTGETYAIVGDFGVGAQVNFPNGQGIDLKFDDKTLMTADLIRILGRTFAGFAVVAPRAFTNIRKN